MRCCCCCCSFRQDYALIDHLCCCCCCCYCRQDYTLIDHLAHFDRERIPERVVHAKGAGAFGYFEVRFLLIAPAVQQRWTHRARGRTMDEYSFI